MTDKRLINTDLSTNASIWQKKIASFAIPGYCDPGLVYDKILQENYCRSQVWIDSGCGHNYDILMANDFENFSIGFDLRDQSIPRYMRADIYRQPFKNSSIDFISCRWVFEHLQNPEAVMIEFLRILKPGGHLLIRTTNRKHYISILSRLLPMSIKRKIVKSEIFPTYFLFNDNLVIERFFNNHPEWGICRIEYIENLHYMNPLVFVFSILYDMVLNVGSLLSLKSTIILELFKKEK